MVENNINNSDVEFKIESELFALVKSILNLNNKYQKGIVNDNFFRKTLKNAMNNLLKLNFVLKEKNLQMTDLLKEMDLSQEYNSVIEIIDRISSLDLPDNKFNNKNRTFLELPGITSEITSSFITLMDALTLDGLVKKDLIFNLFNELIQNLSNFPGLDELLFKIKSIEENTVIHFDGLISDPNLKEELIDDLYQVFKEFQNKLQLNP